MTSWPATEDRESLRLRPLPQTALSGYWQFWSLWIFGRLGERLQLRERLVWQELVGACSLVHERGDNNLCLGQIRGLCPVVTVHIGEVCPGTILDAVLDELKVGHANGVTG